MKATLEFNLPDDIEEFQLASKAGELHSAIHEFHNSLRSLRKHGQLEKEPAELLERIWNNWIEATEGLRE